MKTSYGEHTLLAQRKRRAGQRLIVGLQGTSPSEEFKKFCTEVSPCGFILFGRNVDSVEQVSELNRELKGLVHSEFPALLSVDQEGGRVRRIKETPWPPMRWVGNIDDIQATDKIISLMSEELLSIGFNTNWAPVADVDSNPNNPVIGDRSFSSDPEVCKRHVRASLSAFHRSGIIGCIKHFPGHGDTSVDSHLALPTVDKDLGALKNCELSPFQSVVDIARIIMTAHVMFPAIDEQYPATMSEPILKGILRTEFGYNGLIVSDDLEMKAVRGQWPLEEQLRQASLATVDLFLVCSELEMQWEAYELLVKLQEQSKPQESQAIDSLARLRSLREDFFLKESLNPPMSVIGSTSHKETCDWIKVRGEV
jgi:beta-N-acetylhexosaminidase